MDKELINLELNREEALVFFEFICRFNENEDNKFILDKSEKIVLWNIESILEKELSEPFSDNYKEILQKARAKIKEGK
jgi:hypothetical protein